MAYIWREGGYENKLDFASGSLWLLECERTDLVYEMAMRRLVVGNLKGSAYAHPLPAL